jgi:hypothetical protein
MPEDSQEAQEGPGSPQKAGQGNSPAGKGSSILARLRAGEQVPGYKLVKGRLEKTEGENPRRVREEREFDRLAAMRHVLTNKPSTDVSEGEKACRAWLEKSPGPFMEVYDRLETEAKKQAAGVGGGEEDDALEPTETDVELATQINELLARHRERAKK